MNYNRNDLELLLQETTTPSDLLSIPNQGNIDWSDEVEGQLLLDVYQDRRNIYIKSTIAGVKAEDIDIGIHNEMLTIRGVRYQDESAANKDYFYQECYWGTFSRSIILPTPVKTDKIAAVLKNGILTITLPKIEADKKIKITVNEDYQE